MFIHEIVTWNVRGLGGVEKRRSVRECISKYNPFIVIIQETKKEVMSKLVKSSVGANLIEWCAFPAIGTRGSVLFAWDPTGFVKVSEHMGNFWVSVKIIEVASGFKWLLSYVYGPCRPYNRSEFWEELV